MEEFLHKLVYLHLDLMGRDFYYVCAYVKDVSETHITIIDKTKEEEKTISYRIKDIVEIKLSNLKEKRK